MANTLRSAIDSDDEFFQFISVRAQVMAPGQEVQLITRPNVDGVSLRHRGLRPKPEQFLSVETVKDQAEYDRRMRAYAALIGQRVDVYDDFAVITKRMAVLDVQRVETRRLLKSVGGPVTDPKLLATFAWTVIVTQMPTAAVKSN